MDEPFEDVQAQLPETSVPAHAYRKYALLLSGITLALYLIPFFLLRLSTFQLQSPLYQALNYADTLHDVNADIVIAGDSTGFTGIDPKLLSQTLGLRVVLLPDTYSSFTMTRESALRNYLKANRPPRLVVFYAAAWNLDFDMTTARSFEGDEERLRRGSLSEIGRFGRSDLRELLVIPFKFYNRHSPLIIFKALLPHGEESAVARNGGRMAVLEKPLDSSCRFPDEILAGGQHLDYSEGLLRRYATKETKTLLVIAPIPACSGASVVLTRSYSILDAYPPKVLAAAAIGDDGDYVHPVEWAVPKVTADFAMSLRNALAR